MLVIGLTGGIGSGKSTVANLFAKHHVPIIDTDQLARDVTAPNTLALQQITEKFGLAMLMPNGELNRSALREKIFAHKEDRLWLEKLLHPLIRKAMQEQVANLNAPYCIVVIPLLVEAEKRNPLINRILVVDAPSTVQRQRVQERDHLSPVEIEKILQAQADRSQRIAAADDVIENTGTLKALAAKVNELHEFYSLLSK